MNWDLIMKLLTALALLIGVANTIGMWMKTSGRELVEKIDKALEAIDHQDSRIQSIESELKHIPTKEAVHELTVKVSEVNGKLGTFQAELDGVSRTVDRIERHLLGERA